jgi:hypothetical protein
VAIERDRQRQCLDRERGVDADILKRRADWLGDAEVAKALLGARLDVVWRYQLALCRYVRTQGCSLRRWPAAGRAS